MIQLALALHVRNTLIDAAASGARLGVLADRVPSDGVSRAKNLIETALNPAFAQDISLAQEKTGGVRTLKLTIRAPLPVIGLIGPKGMLEVSGRAAIQP